MSSGMLEITTIYGQSGYRTWENIQASKREAISELEMVLNLMKYNLLQHEQRSAEIKAKDEVRAVSLYEYGQRILHDLDAGDYRMLIVQLEEAMKKVSALLGS